MDEPVGWQVMKNGEPTVWLYKRNREAQMIASRKNNANEGGQRWTIRPVFARPKQNGVVSDEARLDALSDWLKDRAEDKMLHALPDGRFVAFDDRNDQHTISETHLRSLLTRLTPR